MAGILKELLKEKNLDKDSKGRTYSYQDYLIYEIEYKGGRLVISRNFQDTLEGRKQLESFADSFKSSEDVENYFKLKGALKMSLEAVVKEIKQNNKFANEKIDMEKCNPSTITGRLARQRSAKERLKQLYVQYKSELKKQCFFVVVSGEGAMEFASAVSQIPDTEFAFSNTDTFYEDLTNRIDSKLYKNPIRSGYIMDVMGRHFEDMAKDMDIVQFNQIISSSKFDTTISNRDDVLKLVKKVTNEILGAEVAGLHVFEKIAKNSFSSEFENKVLPILITSSADTTQAVATGLKTINPRVFTVAVGDNGLESAAFKVKEVNEKSVLATLNKIKKEIVGKSPKGKANE